MDEPVQPGQILAHKYRVDQVLGVGGMGVVVAATHLELEQKVALKFMHANAYVTEEAKSRFQREARIASKLRSEHVARVTDTGVLENGAPYIVMEYLAGVDLSAQLTQFGPMPIGYAAECIVQACDAVGEAHAHGIVHRDLKPANLFLTQHTDGSPLVKVLDFGISKATSGVEAGMAMTKTGAVLGSPLYMSPEQMRSLKTVDARTDVWALGVILYELLTGRTPFEADNFGDLLLQVMTTPAPPLRQFRPDAPPEIVALIEGCLTKDQAARVQSVAEIARVLAPFCSASGVVLAQRITTLAQRSGTTGDPRVTAAQPSMVNAPLPGTGTNAGLGRSSGAETQDRPRKGWIGLALAIAGVVSVIVVVGLSRRMLIASDAATLAAAPSSAVVTPTTPPPSSAPAEATPPSTGAPSTPPPPPSPSTESPTAEPASSGATGVGGGGAGRSGPSAVSPRHAGEGAGAKAPHAAAAPSPPPPTAPPPAPPSHAPTPRPTSTAAHPSVLETSE